jgi:DNA-binding CsgD family transcriptional regulator
MTHTPGTLTLREAVIVRALIDGATPKQIGADLGISRSAVLGTLHRARARFGAESNEQLVATLFRLGLLS